METPRNTGPLVAEFYLSAAWPNGWQIRDSRTDAVMAQSDDVSALATRVRELNKVAACA